MRATLTAGPVERDGDARYMDVDVRCGDRSTGWTVTADKAGGWYLGAIDDECPGLAHFGGSFLGRTARAAQTALRRMVAAVEDPEDLFPPAEAKDRPAWIPPWHCRRGCGRMVHAAARAAGEGGPDFPACPGAAA